MGEEINLQKQGTYPDSTSIIPIWLKEVTCSAEPCPYPSAWWDAPPPSSMVLIYAAQVVWQMEVRVREQTN